MNPVNYFLWIIGIFIGLILNPMTTSPTQPSTPTVTPVYTCDSVEQKQLDRTTFEFTAAGTAKNGAKITSYTFDFGDGTMITSSSATVRHEYSVQGRYVVKADVNVQLDGKIIALSSNDNSKDDEKSCTVMVTVEKPPIVGPVRCNPSD